MKEVEEAAALAVKAAMAPISKQHRYSKKKNPFLSISPLCYFPTESIRLLYETVESIETK